MDEVLSRQGRGIFTAVANEKDVPRGGSADILPWDVSGSPWRFTREIIPILDATGSALFFFFV